MEHSLKHFVFWGAFCHVLLRASLETDSKKKADRFGVGWWDGDPWISEPQPPAPIGPPPQRPQPVRPPAPLEGPRPPAPLAQPPQSIQNNHHSTNNHAEGDHVTRGGVQVEDIQCIRSNGMTLLSAVLIPPSEYGSQPVFEDAAGPSYTPADCAMRPNEGQQRTFAMYVHHFNKCGVRVQQGSDGKEWISVTIRFPLTEGLRMAEDEYVMVLCKPQDRVATTHHVMDIRGTTTEGRSVQTKKVFRNGPKDMACRMSLMSRPQGTRSFNREMKSGATVRVGQDLQIRAVVKEGDGWNYAMIKDVVITRNPGRRNSNSARASQYPNDAGANSIDIGENAVYRDKRTNHLEDAALLDKAHLVFADGCRNPQYRAVAPFHPHRDSSNPLLVSFVFKAFMFQNMVDGDSLRLSAQVVACAELADCQQAFCNGDLPRDKRKRRTIESEERPGTKNFTEDFQLKVTLGGFSQTPFVSTSSDIEKIPGSLLGDCKIILISVSVAAIVFCLATTSAAAIAIGSKRKGILTPRQEEELRLKKRLKEIKERK
ncbi:uncharacterized protein CDAR_197391 [Caerostris darwini]|uniref:ZP domain-containing protein n=1 Tax=Caerostris darwini TaxID=1538125 RepID=A0AAV4R2R5_9ARAC|nr:uncharacterized protein CDAR_197391 [Caerostris darwini]